MRIAILGAGAMGSWFGGQLAVLGHEVQLLTTNTEYIEVVNSDGLVLQVHGNEHADLIVRTTASLPADYDGSADLIIVLTKSYQTRAAMQSIAHKLAQHTNVLTLQNGLGNAEVIAAFVRADNIWMGMSMMPVDRIAPGIVASRGEGQTIFGHLSAKHHPFADEIVQAFGPAGMSVQFDPEVHSRIWEKVAFNASMNALCALTHGTPGTVGQLPDSVNLLRDVATEVSEVASAEGVAMSLDAVFETLTYACEYHGSHKASMLQDLLSGRRTEVDALNGAIVKLAGRHGISVPLNTILATLVRLAELGDHSLNDRVVA